MHSMGSTMVKATQHSSTNNRGFTLVEMLVTVVVISIIGSSIVFGIGDLIIEKRDEGDVLHFWSELVTLRARAMKDNVEYRVVLTPTGGINNAFKLQVEQDDGSFADVATGPFRGAAYKLAYGRSSVNGDDLNKGVPSGFSVTEDKIDGPWKTLGYISFKPDEMGSINNGIIYFKNIGVKEVGYAIMKTPKSNHIKLYKRSRAAWNEM